MFLCENRYLISYEPSTQVCNIFEMFLAARYKINFLKYYRVDIRTCPPNRFEVNIIRDSDWEHFPIGRTNTYDMYLPAHSCVHIKRRTTMLDHTPILRTSWAVPEQQPSKNNRILHSGFLMTLIV